MNTSIAIILENGIFEKHEVSKPLIYKWRWYTRDCNLRSIYNGTKVKYV